MKLRIDGKDYDLVQGMAKADLYTLFELKSTYGIGMKSILATAEKFKNITDTLDILEDEETFKVFLAIIWLTRRQAGEKLTLEEAGRIPISELEFVQEEGDAPADPPQALTGSVQGGKPATRTSRAKSKTSKSPSTAT